MSSAEEFKTQGNAAFARKEYDEAIDLFSKAISLDESNHVLYSNRSASYAGIQVTRSLDYRALEFVSLIRNSFRISRMH
jgi:stress-induced-phosphoprotein 1